MKLSFCAIAKNEADNLPDCLNSVREVADEWVVVDTGSTDGTPEIAEKLGAKVYEFPWCDDFAAARNASLKYVTGDWVLVLDADERLVPEIIPQIRRAIALEDHLLINLVRQEIGAVLSPYSLVSRLFRNRPDIYFSRPYHALVDDSVAELLRREPDWRIGSISEIAIAHWGYSADAIASRNKRETAKTAMEKYLREHPADPYVASKLGALYVEMGDVEGGIRLLKGGLDQKNAIDPGILYELHYHLGIAHRKKGFAKLAERHYREAIAAEVLPQLKLGAHNNLGNLLKAQGDLAGARTAYETAVNIDPNFGLGHNNLGMVLRAMGNSRGAIAAYRRAIALNPDYAEAHQNLGAALLGIGNLPESLDAFRKAIALYEKTNPAEGSRLRRGLSEMGLQI